MKTLFALIFLMSLSSYAQTTDEKSWTQLNQQRLQFEEKGQRAEAFLKFEFKMAKERRVPASSDVYCQQINELYQSLVGRRDNAEAFLKLKDDRVNIIRAELLVFITNNIQRMNMLKQKYPECNL